MKRSNKTLFLAGWLFFMPAIAFASVQITEIMYDAPGADTGREWVEVTNTGTSAVDISGYTFFEANTNHKLVLAAGIASLLPGDSAVIATDPAKFKADWPAFAGALLDSTFSLLNTGEPLAIKNSAGAAEDSISYSSAQGASGDGYSLHKSGGSFTAALPSPGAFGAELAYRAPEPKPATPSVSVQNKQKESPASAEPVPTLRSEVKQADTPWQTDLPFMNYAFGLAAIIVLGVVAVSYVRIAQPQEATKSLADEFEILEVKE